VTYQLSAKISFPTVAAPNAVTTDDLSKAVIVRYMPLNNASGSCNLSIGNCSFTTIPRDFIGALGHYNDKFHLSEREMSVAPMFMDRVASYDYQNPATSNNSGIGRSPFTRYGENPYVVPRRAYASGITFSAIAVDPVVVGSSFSTATITICEPIICPPLSYGDELKGLCHFNEANLSIDFSSEPRYWFSGLPDTVPDTAVGATQFFIKAAGGGPLGTISGISLKEAALLCNYVIPKEPLPAIIHAPYSRLYVNKISNALSAGDTSTPAQSSNFPLNAMPKRAYIWYEPYGNNSAVKRPNTFAKLTSLNFILGGTEVNFSQADIHQLYLMSARNGCDLSWTEFNDSSLTGAVLCVDFAKDVGLNPDVFVGKSLNQNASFQCTYTFDALPVATQGLLTVVYVNDGYISVEKGGNIQQYNTLFAPNQSEMDLDDSELFPWVRNPDQAFYGGASMRDIGSKIYKVVGSKIVPSARWVASQMMRHPDQVKAIAKTVLDVVPGGEQLMDIAKAVDKFLPQELKDRARDALIGSGRLMPQEGAGAFSGGMYKGGIAVGKSKKSMLDMYRK